MRVRQAAVCVAMLAAAVVTSGWQAAAPAPASKPLVAEDVYNNLQVLKGAPVESVLTTMVQIRDTLGVECAYCHVPHDWSNEEKKPKQAARQMFQMLGFLRRTYFENQPKASCWMCHRGRAVPDSPSPAPEVVARVAKMIELPAADEARPAEQVFKNIQLLKGVPAGRFPAIMAMFSESLGVRCTFCHVPENFHSDDKQNKQAARQMLRMVSGTVKEFYNGDGPIGCSTCHHGSPEPEIARGQVVP